MEETKEREPLMAGKTMASFVNACQSWVLYHNKSEPVGLGVLGVSIDSSNLLVRRNVMLCWCLGVNPPRYSRTLDMLYMQLMSNDQTENSG